MDEGYANIDPEMQQARVSTKSRLPHHTTPNSLFVAFGPAASNPRQCESMGDDENPNRVPGGLLNGQGLKIIRSINLPL